VSVNWDIEELKRHQEEIRKKKLGKLGILNGTLRWGGCSWHGEEWVGKMEGLCVGKGEADLDGQRNFRSTQIRCNQIKLFSVLRFSGREERRYR
jgi:hypothetical protein